MVLRLVDIRRIGLQIRALRNRLGRAERSAAELHDALGHRVDMLVELGAEAVDHLVQRDEVRPLDVPMSLLGQQRQIDRVGEACVQHRDRDIFRIRAEIVARRVIGHLTLLLLHD
jgi:hypothetical protein